LQIAESELTDGAFVLNADDAQVQFHARGGTLQLIAQLCDEPEAEAKRKSLYERLLKSSGTGALNFGASVALDQDKNQILLYQSFQMHALSILELELALDNFLMGMDHYNTAI